MLLVRPDRAVSLIVLEKKIVSPGEGVRFERPQARVYCLVNLRPPGLTARGLRVQGSGFRVKASLRCPHPEISLGLDQLPALSE